MGPTGELSEALTGSTLFVLPIEPAQASDSDQLPAQEGLVQLRRDNLTPVTDIEEDLDNIDLVVSIYVKLEMVRDMQNSICRTHFGDILGSATIPE